MVPSENDSLAFDVAHVNQLDEDIIIVMNGPSIGQHFTHPIGEVEAPRDREDRIRFDHIENNRRSEFRIYRQRNQSPQAFFIWCPHAGPASFPRVPVALQCTNRSMFLL